MSVVSSTTRIVVIGLGYVGLPLAVALARHFEVWGLDINTGRIAELQNGHDRTGEIDDARVERMVLDDQAAVRRRAGGEAVHDPRQEGQIVVDVGIAQQLGVAVALQAGDEERPLGPKTVSAAGALRPHA